VLEKLPLVVWNRLQRANSKNSAAMGRPVHMQAFGARRMSHAGLPGWIQDCSSELNSELSVSQGWSGSLSTCLPTFPKNG
jgi:hypothetical protein